MIIMIIIIIVIIIIILIRIISQEVMHWCSKGSESVRKSLLCP